MLNNVTITAGAYINNEVTLDLNGYTLARPNSTNPIVVSGSGALTVDDTSTNQTGKITAQGKVIMFYGGGLSLTLKAGTIEATAGMAIERQSQFVNEVYVGSTFIMNGGKLISPKTKLDDGVERPVVPFSIFKGDNENSLAINGGVIQGNLEKEYSGSGSDGISAWGITSFLPENHAIYNDANGNTTLYVGSAYTALINGEISGVAKPYNQVLNINGINYVYAIQADYIEAAEGDNSPCIAKIGNNYYTSLSDAISAAVEGDTIKLIRDVDDNSSSITINKNITLDLNEKKLNAVADSNSLFDVSNGFKLTINNGTIETVRGQTIKLQAGASLDMNNVTVTDNCNASTGFIHLFDELTEEDHSIYESNIVGGEYVAQNRGTINLNNINATLTKNTFISSAQTAYINSTEYKYVTGYEINVNGGEYKSESTGVYGSMFLLPGMKANFDGVTIDSKTLGCVYLPSRYDVATGTAPAAVTDDTAATTANATFENCNFTIKGPLEEEHYWLTSLISLAYGNVAQIKSGKYTLEGNEDATKEGYGLNVYNTGGGFIIDGGEFENKSSSKSMINLGSSADTSSLTINKGTFSTTNSSNTSNLVSGNASASNTAVNGGTFTKGTGESAKADTSVSDYLDPSQEVDSTTGKIATKSGYGWIARTGSTGVYDYVIAKDGSKNEKATLLTASGVTEDSTIDTSRYLGVSPYTATITWGSGIADSVKNSYHVATYTKDETAITIAPQNVGFTVNDTSFIGTGITSLTATGSYGIEVNASDENLQLTSIKGGSGNDTLKAGARATTLDGGAGDDILKGNTQADTFIYSGGNDTVQNFGEGDTVTLASSFSPVTDGTKLTNDGTNFVLTFDNSNTLTFTAPQVSASIVSGDNTYVYTKDSITKGEGVTLSASHGTSFVAPEGIESIDASAVTGALTITDNSLANYIIGGQSSDTFTYTGGNDTIKGYTYGTDVVNVTGTPTTDLTQTLYDTSTSKFVIKLGTSGDSLTFESGASTVELKNNGNTYYYKNDRVVVNNNRVTLGSLFSDKNYNVASGTITSIDASKVTVSGGLKITGNSDSPSSIIGAASGGNIIGGDGADTLKATGGTTTLNGGAGNDSLVGGNGTDLFVYTGGTDTVSSYGTGTDTVRVSGLRLAEATYSVGSGNISLGWGGTDNLIFQNVGETAVTVQQGTGNNYYTYSQQYSAHNKSVTLASSYNNQVSGTTNTYDGSKTEYETINAAAVSTAISVMGNSLGNYIFGATAQGGSINGGLGNDKINVSDRSDGANYLFEYTAGKDEVIGFDATKDTVSIAVDGITAAKASNSNSKLALTVNKNKDVLTLRSEDEIEKVSLQSGGYLTKDGYVSGQGLSLFGSARGQIDLNDAIYKDSRISLIAADSVKSQGVTLTGGATGGTFIYAANNKRRDGFVYGGGKVSISGYEAGRDRIDLGSATLNGFKVEDNDDVVLNIGGGGTISIAGAGGQEVLLHDQNIGRGYKKMVFADTGVIENKAKNPTMATVSGAATKYSVPENGKTTIKKIYVTGLNADGASIQAGDKNNTQIDASNARFGVSLSGGAKNDKLIGSGESDLFVYSAGKDVIQGYSGGDLISISSGLADSLGSAKITAGSKSIKFQFTNKNSLTIKANKGETLDGALAIDGTNYTYTKNAIVSGGQATLTSAFGGTFKTDDSKLAKAVTTVDGSAVSKNLTYKGTTSAESLVGGAKKTTFRGAGGDDKFVGGSGKDIFFYAKGEKGNVTIADFEFGSNGRAGNDKLKIASGTIGEITTVEGGGVQFAMNSGTKNDTTNIGWFNVTSGATYNSSTKQTTSITPTNVAIKANNTYYWFADKDITAEVTVKGSEGKETVTLASAGQLVTSDTRVSASDVSSYDIIDLNYSTNLAKSGVAVKVAGVKPTPKSGS